MADHARTVLNKASIRELARGLREIGREWFTPNDPELTSYEQSFYRTTTAILNEAITQLRSKATLTQDQWRQLCNDAIRKVYTSGADVFMTEADFKTAIGTDHIDTLFETTADEQKQMPARTTSPTRKTRK